MELPQPHSFGTQGRKPTHDFLSLYSPAHQDPTFTSPGGYLKTHDLLQPLERVGKNGDEITCTEKPMSMVEHNILPGGIGSYSINHISYMNQIQSQRSSKPEAAQSSSSDRNDENSNCTSFTTGNGNGFTLWEESTGNKGKTGKENIAGNRHFLREGGMKIGGVPWTTSPSQSSSIHNHPTTNICHSGQKYHSFVDMLKSAKPFHEDDGDDHDNDVEFPKKESLSHHKVKIEPKPDQKPNILRSKHSATEQRRRSKINDRFSMLRDVIPNGDQKRDKASFLLEVIEYIQFLQEKVHKYEDSFQKSQRPQVPNGASGPPLVYADKLNENNINIVPKIPPRGTNILGNDMSSLDQHPRSTKQASSFPAALKPIISQSGHEPELCCSRSCATDCSVKWENKLKEQELIIENGTISISTIYSQGLLSTLTEALQSFGVELSRATISIQIDLGKRANSNSLTPNFEKTQIPGVDKSVARAREEENDHKALKRLKTSIN